MLQAEDTIRLDLEELAKEAGNYGNQLEAVEQAIEQAKEVLSKLQEEATRTKVRSHCTDPSEDGVRLPTWRGN